MMFKKLKWRFVVLIMSMLCLVFVGIFGSIYFLTANNLEMQTRFTLEKIMTAPPKPFPDSRDAFGSVIMETDDKGQMVKLFSYTEVDESNFESAAVQLFQGTLDRGKIKIGYTSYAYLKHSVPSGMRVVLVDRSSAADSLKGLLMIFLWVGGVSLLVLFGISLFFASRAVKPIQSAFEKQQQFVADASHELRTPLTVIRTQLALLGDHADPQEQKWLRGIRTETEQMTSLITDMLDLAKLDHGISAVRLETSLNDLMENCLLSYEAVFFEKSVDVAVEATSEVRVFADPAGVRRILVILLDNAVKYTPPGGQVDLRLGSERQRAVLSVRNTGEGVPEDQLEAIFDRFVRLDASRTKATGGYGLGLAIARAIAEQNGGSLKADSIPGEWTQMTLALPLHQSQR
jgi:signal transduction histidine kinase